MFCYIQQIRLLNIRSTQLEFNTIARKKLIYSHYTGLYYLINKELSIQNKIQIVEIDLESKIWTNIFYQKF